MLWVSIRIKVRLVAEKYFYESILVWIKMLLAGAKLSHLVQKDKIWDHGSMTEQVKNIFYQLEKAKNKKETTAIKKYVTMKAYDTIDKLIRENGKGENIFKNTVLTEISIIEVNAGNNKNPDGFTALIKGKRKQEETPEQQRNDRKDRELKIFQNSGFL